MAKSKREIDKDALYRKIMPSARPVNEDIADTPPLQEVPTPVKPVKPAGIQFKEQDQGALINLMEELVVAKLDISLARFSCCKCNKCKKDIAAIALNQLPPSYAVVSEHDEAYRAVEREHGSEVTAALVKAILTVRQNPRH